MESKRICQALALAVLLWGQASSGTAEDEIERLQRGDRVPKDLMRQHGYSDFTDPVGRFLDLLAAGALADARALQPDACATWLATRQESPLTGKFSVWDTVIDLNVLCAPP